MSALRRSVRGSRSIANQPQVEPESNVVDPLWTSRVEPPSSSMNNWVDVAPKLRVSTMDSSHSIILDPSNQNASLHTVNSNANSVQRTSTLPDNSDVLVDLTATQSLSNKTINAETNTLILASSNLTDAANLVTLTGTQVLQNKTLTSPTTNGGTSNSELLVTPTLRFTSDLTAYEEVTTLSMSVTGAWSQTVNIKLMKIGNLIVMQYPDMSTASALAATIATSTGFLPTRFRPASTVTNAVNGRNGTNTILTLTINSNGQLSWSVQGGLFTLLLGAACYASCATWFSF